MHHEGETAADPVLFPWTFRFLVWLSSTLGAALVGPFTTYIVFGFPQRLVYWATVIGLAILVGVAIREAVLRAAGTDGLRLDLVIAGAQTSIIGPGLWAVNERVMALDVGGVDWFFQHVLTVLLIALGVVMVRDLLRRQRNQARAKVASSNAPLATAPPERRPDFIDLLDEDVQGKLRMISADDHYLRVVTTNGKARILMRFRDAVAQLGDVRGFRIHRSHWVSEEALVRVRSDGRRYLAELDCGREVPVSQAYVEDLRKAGYIE